MVDRFSNGAMLLTANEGNTVEHALAFGADEHYAGAEAGIDFAIPRPPYSTNFAFCKITGQCLGMVIGASDSRGRRVPEWMTRSATYMVIWTGVYINYRSPDELTFEWRMD